MKTLTVTPALRSAIYRAAREHVYGWAPFFECGLRQKMDAPDDGRHLTANMRLVDEDEDLQDHLPLRDLKTVEADGTGVVQLDLYATTGRGMERELETNVYVQFDRRGVLKAWGV